MCMLSAIHGDDLARVHEVFAAPHVMLRSAVFTTLKHTDLGA